MSPCFYNGLKALYVQQANSSLDEEQQTPQEAISSENVVKWKTVRTTMDIKFVYLHPPLQSLTFDARIFQSHIDSIENADTGKQRTE